MHTPGARRRRWGRSLALPLVLALALVAFLAPTGQAAQPAEWPTEVSHEFANGSVVRFTCTQVSWTFNNFPEATRILIAETLILNGSQSAPTEFRFEGPRGSYTTSLEAPPGRDIIRSVARWTRNRTHGVIAFAARLSCPLAPSLSVEKLQEIAGSGNSFTAAPLTGLVGQTVDYEALVANTGNVPVTLGSFTDPRCDAGSVSGGPIGGVLAVGASSTYACSHLLDEADQSAGSYANTVTLAGTILGIGNLWLMQSSNTVVVKLPRPALSVEKLQEIAGSGGSFTAAPLTGLVGQTVDYEVLVANTGNVPVTLGSFTDPRCDAGSVSGGPIGGVLAVGASRTYACSHLLDEADRSAGSYANTVTLTGTRPVGEGSQASSTSNTVIVNVPTPVPSSISTTGSPQSASTSTSPPSSPKSGTSGTSGVLGFKSGPVVPGLKGPHACVRTTFSVRVKSAGVKSVTFYLDGHKLKTLTARNAHKGWLTLAINPAKVSVGAHRLSAMIKMALAVSSTAKPALARRSLTIVRCH